MEVLAPIRRAVASLRSSLTAGLEGGRAPVRTFRIPRSHLGEGPIPRARPPVAGILLDWQSTAAHYPPHNFSTFINLGYRGNAVFRRCVDILASNFAQGRLTVAETATKVEMPDSPMLQLFRGAGRPAPRVTESQLWKMFMIDAFTTGNALWEKVRGVGTNEVVELWRLDPQRVAIEPDPVAFIKQYRYNVGGRWYPLAPEDVLHWKFADPLQPWFGIPPIFSAGRDLAVDNSIVDHVKLTLQNLAVPPAVLTHPESVTPDEAEEILEIWQGKQGGLRKGRMGLLAGGTDIKVIGMNLSELAVGDLVATSETRMAMVHGIPIILLGRSGTQADPTRANYAEAKEHFWFDTVLPLQTEVADQVTRFLLAEWDPSLLSQAIFDNSGVMVLQDAKLARATKAQTLFSSGLVSRHAAQRLAGLATQGPDVYYRPATVSAVIPAAATDEIVEIAEVA